MNYEKFNEAMCRLRQAEENLHEALQDVAGAINEAERKQQKFQENNDEKYRKGLKDLHEALRIISAEDGMSISDLNGAFGVGSVCGIVLRFTPEEIIDNVNQWKAKKKQKEQEDQELHVGDEVTITGSVGFTYIILYRIYETEDLFKLIEPTSLMIYTYSAQVLTKTGKHYDSIPLTKERTKK